MRTINILKKGLLKTKYFILSIIKYINLNYLLKMKKNRNLVIITLFAGIVLALKYREQLSQEYLKWNKSAEIVMFGDSHIANGNWNSIITHSSVLRLGWGGYTSKMLVDKIYLAVEYKPKYVFILCGGNDIYATSFKVEGTLNNLKLMVDTLRINNITPVFQKLMYQHNNPEFNTIIDSINSALTKYCLKENIDIIDIGKNMYDSSGLKANLTVDNLHLNEKGYAHWSEAINNYMQSH